MNFPTELTEALPRNVWAPLNMQGWLRIAGDDAQTFLQGQLSSDVRETGPARAQATSHSNAKGRVLFAGTLLCPQAQAYLLELPRSMLGDARQALQRYVLRAKLTIDALGDGFSALGLMGPAAAAALESAALPVPDADWAVAAAPDHLVMRRPGAAARYVVYGARSALERLQPALTAHLRAGTAEDWHRAEVLSGMPVVLPQTREHFVAQMLNLDRFGGIGLNKGCYTGQEVIARVHYLGTLKRRMVLAWSAQAAAPGDSVLADGDSGQAVGEVADCAALPAGGFALLVVVQLSALAGALRLVDGDTKLQVQDYRE